MHLTADHSAVLILGIPIDNVDFLEAVERIFSLVEAYQRDRQARYVATVNVDFMVNTLAWQSENHRHPELLFTLRQADLVTADGMPIIWLSKLLGAPLKERVTGADLVPRLAEEAARRKKSIYFLGGREGIAERAAYRLRKRFSKLIIAGTSSPFVHVAGEELANAEVSDRSIIREINSSGADILLIAFGNPKQEIWFNRNRNKLKVPVTLGIGGTFKFVASTVKRAPVWMQKTGVEWIFRFTQDPKRLWRRYFVGFIKIIYLALPVVFSNCRMKWSYRILRRRKSEFVDYLEFKPDDRTIRCIRLPSVCDQGISSQINRVVDDLANCPSVVLDFAMVGYIDVITLASFVSMIRGARRLGVAFFLIGVSPSVKNYMIVNRIWEFFSEKMCQSPADLVNRLLESSTSTSLRYSFQIYPPIPNQPGFIELNLLGQLDGHQLQEIGTDMLLKQVGDQNCLINLQFCTFIDSTGIGFLVRIRKKLERGGKACCLCNLAENIRQALRVVKLDKFFPILPDLPEAKRLLRARV